MAKTHDTLHFEWEPNFKTHSAINRKQKLNLCNYLFWWFWFIFLVELEVIDFIWVLLSGLIFGSWRCQLVDNALVSTLGSFANKHSLPSRIKQNYTIYSSETLQEPTTPQLDGLFLTLTFKIFFIRFNVNCFLIYFWLSWNYKNVWICQARAYIRQFFIQKHNESNFVIFHHGLF